MNGEQKSVIKNAIISALKYDGYNKVIIIGKDGAYSFAKYYEGCCPEWYGHIVGKIVTFWENGILKARYEEMRN